MSDFEKCKYADSCAYDICVPEFCNEYEVAHMTHGDRIRAMTDEELENGIRKISIGWEPWCDKHCKMNGDDDCNDCLKKYIKQPVKEDTE